MTVLAVVFIDSQILTGAQLRGLKNLAAMTVLRVTSRAPAVLESTDFAAADIAAMSRRLPVLSQLELTVNCARPSLGAAEFRSLAAPLSTLRLRVRVDMSAVFARSPADETLFPFLRSLELTSFTPPT
jgi:hypothetical protein